MREYFELNDSFHETVFDGGKKNVSLPLILPLGETPGRLVFECAFTPPEETGQNCFFLELDSLSGSIDVYCGGEKAASLHSVYSRVRAELTDFIKQNEQNTLRLEIVPAGRADGTFAFGGARIIMTDKAHFRLSPDGDPGVDVRTVLRENTAHVTAKASVILPNNYDVAVFTLFDPKGRLLDSRTEKPTDAKADFILEAPDLWDGPHSPALYTLEASLRRDSVVLDTVRCTFGIRNFEITKDGFFTLNGIKNPLCGVSLANFTQTDDDFEAIKELDANCVRFRGLPADDDILSRCDEAGLLAWIELPGGEEDADAEEAAAVARLAAFHPSAAVMSTAAKDPAFAKKWCAGIKNNTQYVFTALDSDVFSVEGIIDAIPDVLAIHVPASTALPDFTKLGNRCAELRDAHPEFRYAVFSDPPECIFDRHSANAVRSDSSQEYFSAWHERFWDTFGAQKNVIGVFPGELSDRDTKTNRRGLLTFDREEKKDAFWFYRAQFSATGFIRLCSSGQTFVKAKTTDVKCYTNAPKIRLTVNGKENKKYACEKLSDCVYVFRNVKLKRKNNTIVVTADGGTDSAVIFRSRSRLSKK